MIGPFLRRLGQLLDDPFIPYHIGQKRGALDIRQAILNGEILLIHLPLDDMAYRTAAPVMGTLLMMQIYAATFSFGNLDRDKRPNFCLLVDEFTKWVYDSGDEFKDLFSLGRKYGISQVLLMQYTSQLDEQNLKSLKDGITSAKTFISLRSTLLDGPHLAPRFTSLKRRPTDIYREVLPHLEDAKNPALLKEFYWDTVRPLQLAAKLDKDRKTGELPSFNFGFGLTTFEPSLVTTVLERLNTIFYYAQKEGQVQERVMQGVLEQYGRLVGLIQTDFVDDASIISQIRNYESYIPPLEQEEKEKLAAYVKISDADKQEYITAYDKLNLPTDTHIRLVYAKIIEDAERESIIAKKKIEELEELSEVRSFFSNTSQGRDPRKVATYIDLDGMQRTQRIYEAIEEIKKRYEVLGSTCTVYPMVQRLKRERDELEQRLADYKYPWHLKWKDLERKHEEERENIRKKYAEAIASYTRKIAELKRQIKKEIQVELSAMKPVRAQMQQVLMILIAEPLAADKSELSASDIASLLPHLADRHGYIKTPSGVSTMKTTDLSRPVPLDETSARWNTILSQTKKKYCPKGRAEINQEIETAFKKRLLPQDKPVNNETASGSFAELTGEDSEKLRAQQGQEPIDPKKDSGKQKAKKKREDVFDMLDANESTE